MTRTQLKQIKDAYDIIENGQTHPLKTTTAFLTIQPDAAADTPMRVKINTIQRFMMLSFRDEHDAMVRKEKLDAIQPPMGSIGTVENLPMQSHSEVNDDLAIDVHNIRGFLTKEEKQEYAEQTSNTTLELVKDGKKTKRNRSPNGTRKTR